MGRTDRSFVPGVCFSVSVSLYFAWLVLDRARLGQNLAACVQYSIKIYSLRGESRQASVKLCVFLWKSVNVRMLGYHRLGVWSVLIWSSDVRCENHKLCSLKLFYQKATEKSQVVVTDILVEHRILVAKPFHTRRIEQDSSNSLASVGSSFASYPGLSRMFAPWGDYIPYSDFILERTASKANKANRANNQVDQRRRRA